MSRRVSEEGEHEPIKVRYAQTPTGFQFGAAEVIRVASNPRGWVYIEVVSGKGRALVYVTKTGKMRLFANSKEVEMPKL